MSERPILSEPLPDSVSPPRHAGRAAGNVVNLASPGSEG
jgi:hypothetical protein